MTLKRQTVQRRTYFVASNKAKHIFFSRRTGKICLFDFSNESSYGKFQSLSVYIVLFIQFKEEVDEVASEYEEDFETESEIRTEI